MVRSISRRNFFRSSVGKLSGVKNLVPLNLERCRRLVHDAVGNLALDLSEQVVLTEAATGAFALTASIAALAGAARVLILGKDSRFGSAAEAVAQTLAIAREWNCADGMEILAGKDSVQVSDADIVTNLRALRPLDRAFIQRLKTSAVVPLMFETWEYRHEDLDLEACKERGIAVLGTNERYPGVEVLSYLGPVAVRLVLEAGVEVFRSRIIVLGSGVFAAVASGALRALGAEVDEFPVTEEGAFDHQRAARVLRLADVLLVAEHVCRRPLLGRGCRLSATHLAELNPGLIVVHIAGDINQADLTRVRIRVHPETIAPPGYMSVSTAHVGPAPVIRLHTAGLKVGELLARLRLRGLTRVDAEREALRHPLCQGFDLPAHV
jgi:hypothetical protein